METVRLPTVRLERFLLKVEELLTIRLSMRRHAQDLRTLVAEVGQWQRECLKVAPAVRALRSVGSDVGAPDHEGGRRLEEYLERQPVFIKSLEQALMALRQLVQRDQHAMEMLVDDLLGESKKLLMLPFTALLGVLPKLMRDLCRDLGKEAELVTSGTDIEIDKRILQELKDPLIHLVRNSLDHGIETVEVRTACRKPPRGVLTVAVSSIEGGKVELRITDDGAGIHGGNVKDAAVRLGVISVEAASRLTDAEALALIFRSDVSTSSVVTAISGRGLGLAIVREGVEKLGGHVYVETVVGTGTTFRLVVPLTLATFRGLLIEAGGGRFVIPAAHIERVGRIRPDEMRRVGNRDAITIDGRAISLVWIKDVLGLRGGQDLPADAFIPIVVLIGGDKRIAFAVTEVLTEEEVLVKPLTRPLVRVRNVAGITVLGSGKAVPVLNAIDLIKSAIGLTTGSPIASAPGVSAPTRRKRILVVEDSITSRMLIKSIIESAGYDVKTTVDGVDGLSALQAEEFDAVVSDVDMPRMNGFELTARIRREPRLEGKPVVLVTALSSPADRERGLDAGANAYIVKGSFDQSDLLNALRRVV